MTLAPGITLQGCLVPGKELDLHLLGGECTCLLGSSGIGKSTLLRVIAGLGTHVDFIGEIRADDGADIASRIAYMAQDDLLLPWASVAGNVGIGAVLRHRQSDPLRVRQMLERVGLADHADKKPTALSGGERQRVALARTLMEDKPIILLDEPFSALDAKTRSEMQDLAMRLLQGRTILLVTHDPAEAARLARRIIVMTTEGLIEQPTPSCSVPRAVDDPETLRTQGALLKFLREIA